MPLHSLPPSQPHIQLPNPADFIFTPSPSPTSTTLVQILLSQRPGQKPICSSQSHSQDAITMSNLSNVNLTVSLFCLKHVKGP